VNDYRKGKQAMSILDKYNSKINKPQTLTERIVFRIMDDFRDRSGFDDWWGNMDSEIKNEILNSLHQIVEREQQEK
jgi:hypothetical protein